MQPSSRRIRRRRTHLAITSITGRPRVSGRTPYPRCLATTCSREAWEGPSLMARSPTCARPCDTRTIIPGIEFSGWRSLDLNSCTCRCCFTPAVDCRPASLLKAQLAWRATSWGCPSAWFTPNLPFTYEMTLAALQLPRTFTTQATNYGARATRPRYKLRLVEGDEGYSAWRLALLSAQTAATDRNHFLGVPRDKAPDPFIGYATPARLKVSEEHGRAEQNALAAAEMARELRYIRPHMTDG